MNGYETIRLTQDPRGVARLVLARPERHNALNGTMIRELRIAITQLRDDHSVRVVLLSGEGATFCSGGDITWMREQADANRAINATKAPRRRIGIGMPYPLSYQSWLMDTDDSRLFHMTQVTLPI